MLRRRIYLLCLIFACSNTTVSQSFFPVKDSGSNLFGLKSRINSQWKVKPKFENLEGEKLFTFKSGDTLGIIDQSGKILLSGVFTHLYYDPAKGNAIVQQNDLYGYWDTLGNYLPPISKYEISFEKGVAYFNSGSTQGFMDKKGKKIIEIGEGDLWDVGSYGFISSNSKECVYDGNGQRIRDCEFDKIIQMKEELIVYLKDGKYGVMNYKGEDQLYDHYEYISPFNEMGISVVMKEKKYGLMNEKLELILPLESQLIDEFGKGYNRLTGKYKKYSNYSIIKNRELFGVINDAGKVLIEPQYGMAMIEGNYLLKYIVEDNMGLLDIRKQKRLPLIIILDFVYDKTVFCFRNNETKCGIVNKQGKILVKPVYKSIRGLPNGNFIVENNIGSGIIDTAGQSILQPVFKEIKTLNDAYKNSHQHSERIEWDGYVYLTTRNGKSGVATQNGKIIIDTSYKSISSFDENCNCWFAQDKRNKWEMINLFGKSLSPKLDTPEVFNEGLAVTRRKNKYGIINAKGKTVIPFKYKNIQQEMSNVYYFRKGSSWGLLNKKGIVTVNPIFKTKTSFIGQYAFCKANDFWQILDSSGRVETLLKVKDLQNTYNTRMVNNIPVLSFSYNTIKGYDEVSLDLIADHPNGLLINNFILDSKKDIFEKERKSQGCIIVTDSLRTDVDSVKEYQGIGSELLIITKNTFTLNEFTEESKGGSSKVEELYKNYLVREDSLMEVSLKDIFNATDYLTVLNALALKSLMKLGASAVADTLVFDTENFKISPKGLIIRINKRIVPDMEAFENPEVLIVYDEIRSIVDQMGPLKEFFTME